jgi:hypothetical protein
VAEAESNDDEVCVAFSQIRWHDSKLVDLHLVRDGEKKKYDLRLNLDLIEGFSEGRSKRSNRSALFLDCRIIQADLDLLGVLICGGDIASAVCYANAVDLEKKSRNKARQFDFPQRYNPLEKCLGFLIEMINPGGEIIVFAKDFELV